MSYAVSGVTFFRATVNCKLFSPAELLNTTKPPPPSGSLLAVQPEVSSAAHGTRATYWAAPSTGVASTVTINRHVPRTTASLFISGVSPFAQRIGLASGSARSRRPGLDRVS